jgi:RHS repeat-associated protein
VHVEVYSTGLSVGRKTRSPGLAFICKGRGQRGLRIMKHPSRCLLLFALLCVGAAAQVARGTPPFGSFGGGPDVLNLGNLNAHFSLPVFARAGRSIPFAYNLSYDTSIWVPNSSTGWQPVDNWGWSGTTDLATPATGKLTSTFTKFQCPLNHADYYYMYVWNYVDKLGVPHPFPDETDYYPSSDCGTSSSINELALDGSGYYVSVTGNGPGTVTWRSGTTLGSTGILNDSNGNQITVSGSQIFDTLSSTAPVLTMSGTPSSSPVKYKYTNPQGTSSYVTVNYKPYLVQTDFGCGIPEYSQPSIPLVDTIVMPDNSGYTFTYETTPNNSNAVTGRLASITLPTGGSISYTYTGSNNGIICADGSAAGLQRIISPGGTWTYARSGSGSSWTTTETSPPDGTANDVTTISFEKDSASSSTNNFYETQRTVNHGSTLLATTITCYNGNNTPANCHNTAVQSPISEIAFFRYLPNASGSQAETDTFYDGYGLVTSVSEHDFGSGNVGPILRQTQTAYNRALTNGIVDRPSSVKVYDVASHLQAQTTYTYDEGSVTASGATQLCVFGQPTCPAVGSSRGNLTTVATETNISSGATLYRKFNYYDSGMIKQAGDASNTNVLANATTYTYASGSSCNYAFPTLIGEPLSLSRSMTWFCDGGVMHTAIDENSQQTTYYYRDANFWRLNEVTFPDSGATSWTYNTTSTPWNIVALTKLNSSADIDRETVFDGLGRVVQTQLVSDPSGIDTVDTVYDALGRIASVSNPHRTGGSPTDGTTSYAYDALGRPTQITSPASYGTSIIYKNRDTEISTPAKTTIVQSDGLGRATTTCEISSTTQVDGTVPTACKDASGTALDISATGFASNASYDVLGNTLTLKAGTTPQTRTFAYDALSRLTSEAYPESGTTSYVYDTVTAGALYSKTSPAPNQSSPCVGTTATCNTLTYQFDALHRLTEIFNSGGAGVVAYVYDQATAPTGWPSTTLANPKGRLSWSSTAATSWDTIYGYDTMGRVNTYGQCTPANCGLARQNIVTYSYNYAGEPLNGNNIYHNGTLVTWSNSYNNAGQLTDVTTNWLTGTSSGNFFSRALYNPLGSIASDLLGNGLQEAWSYTKDGAASTYSAGSTVYNWGAAWSGPQVTSSSDSINTNYSYTYDDLARLKTAGNGTNNFSYGYDRWGNRWNQTVTLGSGPQPSYGFGTSSTNTNRITSGVNYDAAGNMTYDGTYYYTYDLFNRAIAVGTSSGASDIASYAYDSRGLRAQQNRAYGNQEYYFDLSGNILSTITSGTDAIVKSEAVVNGRRMATQAYSYNTTYFHHYDWVGSFRANTDLTGAISGTSVNLPFGDGLGFTGGVFTFIDYGDLWWDIEDDLYHADNREQSPTQGRWLTPDPAGLAVMDVTNPQTWNRYAYVTNNPISFVDPSGLNQDACGGPHNTCGPGNSPGNSSSPGFSFSPGGNGSVWAGATLTTTQYFWVPIDPSQYSPLQFPDGSGRVLSGGYWDSVSTTMNIGTTWPPGIATIGPAPQGPRQRTPSQQQKSSRCTRQALLAAGGEFVQTFIPNIPPEISASTDPAGFALDTAKQGAEFLKNPGVRAYALNTIVQVGKGLLPAAADILDAVPGIDLFVGGLQVGWGAYQGVQAYKEAYDQCMGTGG